MLSRFYTATVDGAVSRKFGRRRHTAAFAVASLAASLLAGAALVAPSANAAGTNSHPLPACYTQGLATSSYYVSSHIAGPSSYLLSNRAVDDFTLGTSCLVVSLTANGVSTGSAIPKTVEVLFYKDCSGVPCPTPIFHFPHIRGKYGKGSLNIVFPHPVSLPGPATYWLSVVPYLPSTAGTTNYWGWSTVSGSLSASPASARWQNPGGGWSPQYQPPGTCTTYYYIASCLTPPLSGADYNLAFTLYY